jgi:carboxyl-terminal processing protease
VTLPAPRPDRSLPARAGRLVSGLLLLTIGAVAGTGVTLVMPAAQGADPSPAATPRADGLPPDIDLFGQAYDIVKEFYVDPAAADDQALVEGAIRGMVDALGDTGHTVYLTREELEAENQALDGSIIGIGVSVDMRAGSHLIISVLDGSPADQAGLRAGELILAVDGTRVDRSTTDELIRLVRGEPGTPVVLRIRGRDGAEREVTINRDRIDVPAASWAFVPGTRIAVIRLAQFSSGAGREVADAARAAVGAEANAVILDLRGNPGGLLNEAVAVASTFLEDGTVYRYENRDGNGDAVEARGEAVVPDLPMVVLVDYGSASSAEIVAAALRDNDRARVVGQTTYGTGTVLNVFPLDDGSAIRLGVQRWLTPEGEDVFEEGLVPDISIALPADGVPLEPSELEDLGRREFRAGDDTQLRRAVRLLEADRG